MYYTPLIRYRSPSCKALAEKIARAEAIDSLNVKVNIDTILPNRSEEVVQRVAIAIAESTNFVLYSDKRCYVIIIPCKLAVACYVNGVQQTLEVMKDMQQFQNRVKIAFVVYDKFYSLDRFIESGRNGNDPVPLHTNRENVCDGKEGA